MNQKRRVHEYMESLDEYINKIVFLHCLSSDQENHKLARRSGKLLSKNP